MAGFLERFKSSSLYQNFSKALLKISSLGMSYEDMILSQSKAIGISEQMFGENIAAMPEDLVYSLRLTDIQQRKYISFFDQAYEAKRAALRNFALNGEIEWILDTICDEAIVYNDMNFFCSLNTSRLKSLLNEENGDSEEIINDLDNIFVDIYNKLYFNDGNTAWNYFRKYLIDGFLAFEIIYDKNGKNIIGFKEIDPITIHPAVQKGPDNQYQKIWVQNEDKPALKRILLDSQIIYISYSNLNFINRVSYLERLVRSFNLLRLMENTRLIWNIMNSTYRLKMIVPIGTQSRQRAQESLAELRNRFKEDISMNFDTGELFINGRARMQFYINYLMPSKGGESPQIETIGGEGPDLNDTEALKYFQRKLQIDSKIPLTRFERETVQGFQLAVEGIDREEIRFAKFINRLRSNFKEIILKPVIIQILLKYGDLFSEQVLRANLGLTFNKDNVFEQLKWMELTLKRLEFCNSLSDFKHYDDSPYFSKDWIVQNYLGLSNSELESNKKFLEQEKGNESEESEEDEDSNW